MVAKVSLNDGDSNIDVEKYTVVCDGPEGALGHPRVALSLEKDGGVVCPYCSQHFVRRLHESSSSDDV